jgi:DNA-binding winged helix-turn-helix (wHTH) protein
MQSPAALPGQDLPYLRGTSRADTIPPREADLAALFADVRDMQCTSVVGVSNFGKSALLRAMTDPQVQQRYLDADAGVLFIYVDFNQMLEMSEQAFCELVLRCSLETLHAAQAQEEVLRRVETAYTGLVAPASSFEVPLRFAQAMAAIGDRLPQRVVFLLDELDEAVRGIDGRVFLNLRALKDRHWQCLSYVTATNRRLAQLRQDPEVAEFGELFDHHIVYVSPMTNAEIAAFATRFAADEGVTFSDDDLAFLRLWAGGHPGLLEAASRVLGLVTGRPTRDPSQDWIIHRRAAEILVQDLNIQAECRKMWADLTPGEQEALLSLHRSEGSADGPSTPDMESMIAKHLVVGQPTAPASPVLPVLAKPHGPGAKPHGPGAEPTGPESSELRVFARAFQEFTERQGVTRRPAFAGIRLDPDSGEVWVQGAQVPTLTNLEYRLLLLLYGRLGKICSKYDVVEAVWGEDYIDEVDDARIEKLVSRLRQKIEPDPNGPRYVQTIRGRGYKLVQD